MTILTGKVLFLTQEFTYGGAAYLTLRHIQRLSGSFAVELLITGSVDSRMIEQLPPEITVYRPEWSCGGSLKDIPLKADALGSLEFLCKSSDHPALHNHYEALLATSVFFDFRAAIAVSLIKADRKLVFLVDEALRGFPLFPDRDAAAIECCLVAADLFLPVSGRLWQRMTEFCPPLRGRPFQVLPPPIDYFNNIPADSAVVREVRIKPLVLTVARLSAEKQIMECLRIHHQLEREGIFFIWHVIGTGSEEAALRLAINRLGMTDKFRLLGYQDDIHVHLADCDVFVLFSAGEGCPTVIREALRAGCPVLMTDVNGADELILNHKTGLIVQNDADSMAGGLRKMICESGLRDSFRTHIAELAIADNEADTETEILMDAIARPEGPFPDSSQPLVTIIIPAYNHECFIEQAIASALMQDFRALEVIVADDASADGTPDRVRPWLSDPRSRVVRNPKNLGRVANYRKALTDHARGDWVLMLDGDDYLTDPCFISRAMQAIETHADSPVVFAQAGHRVVFPGNGKPSVDILPDIKSQELLMMGADYLEFVFRTGFFTHLGTLYRRDIALKCEPYSVDISSSDMEFLLRMALMGEVLVMNTIAGCWVQHGANSSSNLGLDDLAPNIRIFRNIASLAVNRGLTSMSRIDGVLTSYESRTLASLLSMSLAKTPKGPLLPFRILAIIIAINPRLLASLDLAGYLLHSAFNLFRKTLEMNCPAVLVWWQEIKRNRNS